MAVVASKAPGRKSWGAPRRHGHHQHRPESPRLATQYRHRQHRLKAPGSLRSRASLRASAPFGRLQCLRRRASRRLARLASLLSLLPPRFARGNDPAPFIVTVVSNFRSNRVPSCGFSGKQLQPTLSFPPCRLDGPGVPGGRQASDSLGLDGVSTPAAWHSHTPPQPIRSLVPSGYTSTHPSHDLARVPPASPPCSRAVQATREPARADRKAGGEGALTSSSVECTHLAEGANPPD